MLDRAHRLRRLGVRRPPPRVFGPLEQLPDARGADQDLGGHAVLAVQAADQALGDDSPQVERHVQLVLSLEDEPLDVDAGPAWTVELERRAREVLLGRAVVSL